MAERLKRLPLDQKVLGSIPGSNLFCSCHSGGSNSYIQAHEFYFQCLPPHLLDETLNGGPSQSPMRRRLVILNLFLLIERLQDIKS